MFTSIQKQNLNINEKVTSTYVIGTSHTLKKKKHRKNNML